MQPSLFTYQTSIDEPPHPDPNVVARLVEAELSDCEFGCKIYQDTRNSNVRILVHSAVYGCRK